MEHIGIDLGSRESQVCVRNGVALLHEDSVVGWFGSHFS